MRFQIPQFIDVEDKIFGPLTLKQFVYLAGAGGCAFLLYRILPGLIAFPLILIVGGLAAALAFYKVNNKPFADFLESALRYALNNKLYIWKKKEKKPEPTGERASSADLYVPRLSRSKLQDVSWSVDVKGGVDSTEEGGE